MENWLEQYGYLALFCGICMEGPLTLSMAGFLAHQGYLNIIGVFLTAFVATFLTIEVCYFVGLLAGQYLLTRWPVWRKHYSRFSALIERHKAFFILVFRFIYGAQTPASIAIGMAKVRPAYFSTMNAAGAALWTLAFCLVGYFFGHAFEMLIDDIKQYEKPLSLVLVALVIVYYLARRLVWRRISKDKNIACGPESDGKQP